MCCLSVASAWDTPLSDPKEQANEKLVHFLNEKSFWPAVRSSECSLIEFYAPWCPHCIHFRPSWAETAKLLADKHSPCQIGSIDSQSNRTLSAKFGVRSYPSIFFFRRDAKDAVSYKGTRTPAAMAAWLAMKAKSGPPLAALRSVADVDKLLLTEPQASGDPRPALVLLRVSRLADGVGPKLAAGAPPAEVEAAAAIGTLSEEMEGRGVKFALVDSDAVVARASAGLKNGNAEQVGEGGTLPSGMAMFVAGGTEVAESDAAMGRKGTSAVGRLAATYAGGAAGAGAPRTSRYPFPSAETLSFQRTDQASGGATGGGGVETAWGSGFKYFVAGNLKPLVTLYDSTTGDGLLGNTVQVHALLFVDSAAMSKQGLEALKAALAVAAAKTRGRILHAVLDAQDKYGDGVRNFFGFEKQAKLAGAAKAKTQYPTLYLADMRDEMVKYKLGPADLSPTEKVAAAVEGFEARFLAGTLKPGEGGGADESEQSPPAVDDDHVVIPATDEPEVKINLEGVNLRGARPKDIHKEIRV